jgi:hypothetical protein
MKWRKTTGGPKSGKKRNSTARFRFFGCPRAGATMVIAGGPVLLGCFGNPLGESFISCAASLGVGDPPIIPRREQASPGGPCPWSGQAHRQIRPGLFLETLLQKHACASPPTADPATAMTPWGRAPSSGPTGHGCHHQRVSPGFQLPLPRGNCPAIGIANPPYPQQTWPGPPNSRFDSQAVPIKVPPSRTGRFGR